MRPVNKYQKHIGQAFGDLVCVQIKKELSSENRVLGVFWCTCGNYREFPMSRMINANYRNNCGCKTERGKNATHGMHGTPEYSSWCAMKDRCLNKRSKDYPRYGGVGITVHAPWIDSFELFYEHIGPRPDGSSVDRINTTRGYEPGNVRWASAIEQSENTKASWIVQINDQEFPSIESAARLFGVSATTIVRWCDGYTDARRSNQSNGGRIPSKPGCFRRRKYENA